VVAVAGGSYPNQRIDAAPKAHGPKVVFRPVTGAKVTFSSIRVTRGSYIEFKGFRVEDDTYNEPAAQWITYSAISMRQFFIRGADHITYRYSNVGPNGADDGMNWITQPYQSSDPPTHILLNRMRIHDFIKHNSGSHVDCLGIEMANHVTIRNSRFWNCAHFAIIFGTEGIGPTMPRNLTIENNFLDCCDPSGGGYYSIGLGDAVNVLIRFNSMTLGMGWLDPGGDGVTNDIIDSNVIANNASANCSNAVWRYNVVARGSACGGRRAGTAFRDPPRNLHLKRGARAANFGNPKSYPTGDIDGQRRLKGRRPDAGADEFR
jgi:hypothetical protein